MSFQYNIAENLTAVGTTINDALVLARDFDYYKIRSSTANSGVKIPFCEAGNEITISNRTANTILAYPQPTGTINGSSAGTPIALAGGVSISFITSDGINWDSEVDTTALIAPVLTPDQVLATDGAGLLIGAGGYSALPNQPSSFVITDSKGDIPMDTIRPQNCIAVDTVRGDSVTAQSFLTVNGTATINTLTGTTASLSGDITSLANVSGTNLNASGNAVVAGVVSAGSIASGPIAATGNITGTNLLMTGVVSGTTGTFGPVGATNITCQSVNGTNGTFQTVSGTTGIFGTVDATNVTTTHLTASGTLRVGFLIANGSVQTANVLATDIISQNTSRAPFGMFTNISAGAISASGSTSLQDVTCTNLTAATLALGSSLTIPALNCTSVTSSGPITGTSVTASGPISGPSLTTTGGIAGTTGAFSSLTSQSANINSLVTTPYYNTNSYTPLPTTIGWIGTYRMTGFGLGAGASQGFSLNNSNISQNNVVLMNVWLENLGALNDGPIFTRLSQGIGNMTFTIKNPGGTSYSGTNVVIQYIILG